MYPLVALSSLIDNAPNIIGWLSYEKFYLAPQAILTWQMPSDTTKSITGHTDLLPSGEPLLPYL